MLQGSEFREAVYTLMAQVPQGQVTTYGDLAGLAGHAHAARIVGGMAHYGPADLPWSCEWFSWRARSARAATSSRGGDMYKLHR